MNWFQIEISNGKKVDVFITEVMLDTKYDEVLKEILSQYIFLKFFDEINLFYVLNVFRMILFY